MLRRSPDFSWNGLADVGRAATGRIGRADGPDERQISMLSSDGISSEVGLCGPGVPRQEQRPQKNPTSFHVHCGAVQAPMLSTTSSLRLLPEPLMKTSLKEDRGGSDAGISNPENKFGGPWSAIMVTVSGL
jgi:hypothetical protein